MRANWRPLVVIALTVIFLGSLYLGFSLQRQTEESELPPDLFVEQLNEGAFTELSWDGQQVRGRSATGADFVTVLPAGTDLTDTLIAAGADAGQVNDLLAAGPVRPLGERLASQLLWVGPALLLISLLLIVWRGQNLPAER
ncbi:MAG: hypothetical protein KDE28_08390 [Anaerolineales bacterium]|nr:hypothetical protein [Anaerolineales bacterium]MCB0027908.1 hypothetical protein [Anaerolineales bacterium]